MSDDILLNAMICVGVVFYYGLIGWGIWVAITLTKTNEEGELEKAE